MIYLPDLDTAFDAVYRGPLDEFISRRDALVKQLRTSKRRDDAERAKALRKPSRIAWVLNIAVQEDPEPSEQLAAAVQDALDAQSGARGDLRAALDSVRVAVREFADAAARTADANGYATDAATLVPAIMAVIGNADAFAAARAGRLADIPEGGGLDFLAAAPPAPASASTPPAKTETDPEDMVAAERVRTAVAAAEAAYARLTALAQAAQRALSEAEARLDAAEQQLRRLQEDAATRRAEVERTRAEAKKAGAQQEEARRALDEARARAGAK